MTTKTPIRKLALACTVLGLIPPLQAETYVQTVYAPTTSTWNTALIWDNNDVTTGNNYQTAAGPNLLETTFTVNVGSVSTPWQLYATVRDNPGTALPTADSTFNGDNLLIANQTRFLSKARNTTSTANFTLQNGGMMFLAPGGAEADGPGTGTWAGTISTSGNTLIGLEATTNTNVTTLNIVAPISGSGLLTLTGKGGQSGFLKLNGDISGFTGTFLLSSATGKSTNPLTFSIANSAIAATLQLNWESPEFRYDLSTNEVSFGSLILGVDNVLGVGTYTADDLNNLTGNAGLFSGSGTITVVPEPSVYLLSMVGLGFVMFVMRRRRQAV